MVNFRLCQGAHMKFRFAVLLLLVSCTGTFPFEGLIVKSSPKRERKKIEGLQKKLDTAEKAQKKAETETSHLKDEILKAQLALVRGQVDIYEQWMGKGGQNPPELVQHGISGLFIEERDLLHRIIQSGSAPFVQEAHIQLDRILRMITALSDGDFNKSR